MARSQAEKAASHERILRIAGSEFLTRGLEGIGVADLMSAAGLTHGSFYNHFESREKLIEEALSRVFDDSERDKERADRSGRAGLDGYVQWYLSRGHRDEPATGCPVAALAGDLPRASEGSRTIFSERLRRYVGWIAKFIDGRRDRAEEQATLVVSAIVGAVILSRAVNDRKLSDRILTQVRSQLARLPRR